jgi:putative (di)nucleoside polyphosphate hydrolase
VRHARVTLPDSELAGYRPGVGIMLLDRNARVFVGRRKDMPAGLAAWQMPQGGIDPGEGVAEAGLREMREEIGTDSARLLRESAVWRSYDLPPGIARRLWGGRYRGQSQKWLAFEFEGEDGDIRLDLPHPEFAAWRWIRPDRLGSVIVPFKRDVYLSVVDEFRPLWA